MSEVQDRAAVRDGFRTMMRGFPTGVAVVAAMDSAGRPHGMTVSSVCSVTFEPPTVLVCLRSGSPTLATIRSTGSFTINLLHEEAQPVAELFASGRLDRFGMVHWTVPAEGRGPHLSRDAHVVAGCDVSRAETVGDHQVVFGEIRYVITHGGQPPLLYGDRRYQKLPAS